MSEQVAQQPSDCVEGLGPLSVPACITESKGRCVATPKHHVVIIEVGDDVVWLTQEVREGALNDSHTPDYI